MTSKPRIQPPSPLTGWRKVPCEGVVAAGRIGHEDRRHLGHDEGVEVLVEAGDDQGAVLVEIPFEAEIGLVGAERLEQGIAAERRRRAEGEDAEAGIEVVERRPRDRPAGGEADLDLVAQAAG